MQLRQLGTSDLHLTVVGFGAWAVGGSGWSYGWGAQDDADSVRAVHAALDAGVNWIDTAAVYGLGHSEEMVARALRQTSHTPYVFTKCSLVWDEQRNITGNLKAASIRRELEESLRRLQVDTIDLYQIHWPNPPEDIEEGWQTLADLQKAGKVRYIGVSNFDVNQLKRAQSLAPVVSLQPPYSLLVRDAEKEILPYAQEQNIGVIVYSPMQTGLLTGKMTKERVAALPEDDWRKGSSLFQEPALTANLALAAKLQEIGQRHGRNAGQVAIAWTLKNPAVTGAIVGFRNAGQVQEIVGALEFRLAPEEVQEIEAFSAG